MEAWSSLRSGSTPAPSPWGDDGEVARSRIRPMRLESLGFVLQDLEVPHPAPAVLSGACSPETTVPQRCRTPSPSKEDGKTGHRHPQTTLDGWKQPLHSRKLLCTHILKKTNWGERKQNIIFFCIIHAPRHFMHQAGVDNLT